MKRWNECNEQSSTENNEFMFLYSFIIPLFRTTFVRVLFCQIDNKKRIAMPFPTQGGQYGLFSNAYPIYIYVCFQQLQRSQQSTKANFRVVMRIECEQMFHFYRLHRMPINSQTIIRNHQKQLRFKFLHVRWWSSSSADHHQQQHSIKYFNSAFIINYNFK